MPQYDVLPPSLAPRGLCREVAAVYIGVSPGTFDQMVTDGRMPGPKVVKVLKFSKSGNHRPQVKKVTVVGNMRLAAGGTLKRATRRRPASLKKSAQQP